MEVELQIQGEDATEEIAEEIEDWLRNAQIRGLVIQHKSRPAKPGEMGIELATILVGPIADAVKSVFNYLGMRRPKLKVILEIRGTKIEIDAENLKDQDVVLSRIVSILESQGA